MQAGRPSGPLAACFANFTGRGLGVPGGEGDANREGTARQGKGEYLFIYKQEKK